MGFLTRLLIPRGVRRATHPVRSAKRAVTPKSVKKVQRAAHPVSNAKYSVERSLNTKPRKHAAPTRTKPAPLPVPRAKLPTWNYRERKAIMDMRRAGPQGRRGWGCSQAGRAGAAARAWPMNRSGGCGSAIVAFTVAAIAVWALERVWPFLLAAVVIVAGLSAMRSIRRSQRPVPLVAAKATGKWA
jgi:hypothetical protein